MEVESRGAVLPRQWSSGDMRKRSNSGEGLNSGFASQAARVHELQSKLAEVQQQLSHETRRAQLLEQELTHLRSLTLQHNGQQTAAFDVITKHYAQGAIYPSGPELAPDKPGQQGDTAPLDAVPRARPKSMDGYTQTHGNLSEVMSRRRSAPTEELPQQAPASTGRSVSSALHAVSGAYLKEQAANSATARERRRNIPSSANPDSEAMALRFVEEAQPVPLAQEENTVTISRPAFELLVLKDRAINAVKEGITIAECSLSDHPLIFANDAFSEITGYAREEVLGKNCRFLQGPDTDPDEIDKMRAAVKDGKPTVVQLMNYKKNGDPFINYLSITPIHDSSGHITHYVGIQSDISDLVNHKKAELTAKHEAAQAAAATEVKSQFLARMSHEIRTPLNGMIAVGQLLAETVLSPAQWDLMNTIRCSGETLLTLITDILDFSRIEADKMVLVPGEFHLQTVIEAAMEIAGLHAAQKRLQVAYNVADNVPKLVFFDAQRLQQILLNVLNNAVKFTEKGEILVEVWCEPEDSSKAQQAPCINSSKRQCATDPADEEQQSPDQQAQHDGVVDEQQDKSNGKSFRPLTPDNLSQHNEFGRLKTAKHGEHGGKGTESQKERAGLLYSKSTDAAGVSSSGTSSDPQQFQPQEEEQHESSAEQPGTVRHLLAETAQRAQHLISNTAKQAKQAVLGQSDSSQHESSSSSSSQQKSCRQHTLPNQAQGINLQASTSGDSHATLVYQPQQSASQPGSAPSFADAKPASTLEGHEHIQKIAQASASEQAAEANRLFRGELTATSGTDTTTSSSRSSSQSRKAIGGGEQFDCTSRSNPVMASSSGRSSRSEHRPDPSTDYTIHFSIRDSGIGISQDQKKNLFQRFCQVDASPTRRFGGSGLGLAICKKLTEAMGGQMWVESDGLGLGSLFRWTLKAQGTNPNSGRTLSHPPSGERGHASSDMWRQPSISSSNSTVDSGLKVFAGKRVLLVEVSEMVRQVLALALRRWGFKVCAVKNEADAIYKLSLREGHSDFVKACKKRTEGRLSLEHSGTSVDETAPYDADGPYDVVISDMALTQLMQALMQGCDNEADKLVFLGWLGQNEPEEEELVPSLGPLGTRGSGLQGALNNPMNQDNLATLSLACGCGHMNAQLSQETADKMSNRPIGAKQLTYAIVTRPVRQSRLKLALEEVMSSQSEQAQLSAHQQPSNQPPTQTSGTSEYGQVAHLMQSMQSAAEQGLSDPQQASLQASGTPPQELLPENGVQGGGRRSDPMAGQLQQEDRGLDSKLSTQSMPSMQNGSLYGAHAEHDVCQHRRNGLQRAPKLKGHGSLADLNEVGGTRRNIRVLLAEDNLINMKVALGILKRTGYSQVTTVMDGQQAMDELHSKGGANAFDIILTDLHMPRKGGMELVTEVRQLWPKSKVRVVAVTADAFEDRRDQCLSSGFDGWLAKPFRVEDLVRIMAAVSAAPK